MMFRRVFVGIGSAARAGSVPTSALRLQTQAGTRFHSFSTGPQSFQILGIQQIAVGGLDKKLLSSLWVDTFGLKKVGEYAAESENVDEDILSLGHGPYAVEIDLMQPLDPNKAPKVHNPPLNHIGLWVDDLDSAYKELEAKGVR